MNFSIGCDHAGPAYKSTIIEHLKERGFSVKNCGTDSTESVDYPDFAHAVAIDVSLKDSELGILICGSANGVAMTANKHSEVRAAIAWTPEIAHLEKTHNDANVICIPARFVSEQDAVDIVDAFLDSKFEGGRHATRVGKIACGLLTLLLCVSSSFSSLSQTKSIDTPPSLGAAEYGQMMDSTKLRAHLSIIASDEFEGRETGTRGAELTALYLENYYSKLGFEPYDGKSYTQDVPMLNSQIQGGLMNVAGQELNMVDDFLLYPGINETSMKDIPMVFAGFGISNNNTYDDFAKIDVKGKCVVVLQGDVRNPDSEEASPTSKREKAESLGAVAFIIVMPNSDYNTFKGRMKFYMMRKSTILNRLKDGEGASIPTFFVREDAADVWFETSKNIKKTSKIKKKGLKKGEVVTGDLPCTFTYNLDINRTEFIGKNVLAYLPGTDKNLKEEVVVITSHYDHIGIVNGEINNGADDDGSGTVTVMELARVFMHASKNGDGPRRSVLFMNVVGEEKGLLGSEWYSDHPVFPLENTVANLNIDMIGRVDEAHSEDENYIYLIGSDKLSSELHEISESANSSFTNITLDYTFNAPDDPNRFYYRSDHYNFAKHNIPVIFYFSGVHEDYHAPGDDVEKIMFTKMTNVGRLAFHTAWELLNRDEKIVVDKVNDFKN
jgi:RpiB/LacA/LacB family sugar-phosphate isomerase